MAQAVQIAGLAGLTVCFVLGCDSSPPAGAGPSAAVDQPGQRAITLYVPEMSEKLDLF